MSESNWTNQEVGEIIQQISKRSMTDQEFRQQVLNDPGKVIEALSGKTVPEGFKIDVIESKPGADRTFVLPPLQGNSLTDEELDHAAGGLRATSSTTCQNQYAYEI